MLKERPIAAAGIAGLAVLSMMPALAAQPQTAQPGLAPIIVTAEKVAQNVQRVPLSMTTFTSAVLQQQGITNFTDYATRVPNLSFGMTGDGVGTARTIAIRGISGSGTTGFYINDVPLPVSLGPRILDIARIEVLRGPQGTLYGARSMGGAVRIITKKPDFRNFHGALHVRIAHTWNTVNPDYTGDGVFNIPLIRDRVAMRVSGFYDDEAGYLSRRYCTDPATAGVSCFPQTTDPALTTTVRNVYQKTEYGGSAAVTIRATKNLTLMPWVMIQHTGYNGFPLADANSTNNQWGYPYPAWAAPSPIPLPILSPHDLVQGRFFNVPEGGFDYWHLYSLTAKWRKPFGELTSATAYFDRKVSEHSNETGFVYDALLSLAGIPIPGLPTSALPLPRPSAITEIKSYHEVVQELRFASTFQGPFQLVAGVFYSDEYGQIPFAANYPPSYTPGFGATLNAAYGGLGTCAVLGFCPNPANPNEIFGAHFKTDSWELAEYAQGTYKITPKLKATLGMRYSRVKTTMGGYQEGAVVQAPGGSTALINPREATTYTKTTPKVALQYQFTPALMAYVSASEGFRPGGQSEAVPGAFCSSYLPPGVTIKDTRFFQSDSLWDYEIGGKSSLFNNRLQVDASAYDIQWKNIQQNILLACGFQYRANAGAARSRGGELQVNARPIEPLQLSLGLGYENAVITQSAPFSPQRVGDPVFQTPDWTGNASATWTQPITGSLTLLTTFSFSYVGHSFSANNLSPNAAGLLEPRERPAYRLMNARIALEEGSWEVALVGKNLANELANLSDERDIAAEIPGRPRLFVNQPRTIGLSMRYFF